MMVHWGRVWNLTLWVLQGCLAAVFLMFGASKFSAHVVFWVQLFGRIGLGQWFRYFTGALEVICAVLLLIPRASAIAAAILACAMAGAVFIHVFILRDGLAWLFSGFPLLILVAIAWMRR